MLTVQASESNWALLYRIKKTNNLYLCKQTNKEVTVLARWYINTINIITYSCSNYVHYLSCILPSPTEGGQFWLGFEEINTWYNTLTHRLHWKLIQFSLSIKVRISESFEDFHYMAICIGFLINLMIVLRAARFIFYITSMLNQESGDDNLQRDTYSIVSSPYHRAMWGSHDISKF